MAKALQQGFTMIELLLSLTLGAMILVSLSGFTQVIRRSVNESLVRQSETDDLRFALSRIQHAICNGHQVDVDAQGQRLSILRLSASSGDSVVRQAFFVENGSLIERRAKSAVNGLVTQPGEVIASDVLSVVFRYRRNAIADSALVDVSIYASADSRHPVVQSTSMLGCLQ